MTSETEETVFDLEAIARELLANFNAYRESDLSHSSAHNIMVDYKLYAKLAAALSRAPEVEELGSSTRMTSPASRSQTPLSAGQFAWISRPDVIAMLDRVAGLHADLVLEGGDNARLREAMESAFTQAKYAVAFMPTAADQDTSDVREVLGIAPIDPDIERRFGPPTYTEEQVKAYHAALSPPSTGGEGEDCPNPDGCEYCAEFGCPRAGGVVVSTSDDLWDALKRQCCATKPNSEHWDEVSTIVTVRRSDVEAAVYKLKENGLSREERA